MGFYGEQILPRVTEWILDKPRIHALRVETAESLEGRVVEIGFGSGLNLPALPSAVDTLFAIDPAQVGRRLAADRLAASEIEVHFTGLDGQSIPLESDSMDGALSTFTMCSIAELRRALGEIHRVLVPGGRLCFMEHGLSPDPRIARKQRLITPFYRPIAGGCRLDLAVGDEIRGAGFEVTELEEFELGKKAGVTTHLFRGVAIAH